MKPPFFHKWKTVKYGLKPLIFGILKYFTEFYARFAGASPEQC